MTIDSDLTSSRNPRARVDPTSFEIVSIATQLSKGKDPEEYLHPAIDLYWATTNKLEELKDDYEAAKYSIPLIEELSRREEPSVSFYPNSDWDELREYLQGKGLPMKKAETVRRNLREYFNEKGQHEKARKLKSSMSRGGARILETTIDEFVKFKKKRKSEGGKKSHRTKQKRSVHTNVAKK